MATVKTVKELILLCREADVSLYVWGVNGIGKSSIVRQTAEELGIGFIDFRCAPIEASDLRGLPDKDGDGRTHLLPPADLPASGEGILLLDELNRANNEVLAAACQLVLDRRVGQYELPAGWSIVCAGTVDHGDYAVASLDPAFRDRFCHVVLARDESTFDEWAVWMAEGYFDMVLDLGDFWGLNLRHLKVVDNQELVRNLPSRRSWEMLARIIGVWQQGNYSHRVSIEAFASLVGRELAISFCRQRYPITPQDLFQQGVARLADKIGALERNQQMAFMGGVASWGRNGSLHDRKIAEIVLDFAELLLSQEKDLAIGVCTMLIEVGATEQKRPYGQDMALLQNPLHSAAVACPNREQQGERTFLDYLVARPVLASVVAQAMSLEPCKNEEVSV